MLTRKSAIWARVEVGRGLRRMREHAGVTSEAMSEVLRRPQSWMSRVEAGKTKVTYVELQRLLEVYRRPEVVETLWDLIEGSPRQEWWYNQRAYVDKDFGLLLSAERVARRIRTFQPQTPPALTQTEQTSAAIIAQGTRWTGEQGARERAALRASRSGLLVADSPPDYHAIIDEPVLRRAIGSSADWRAQLEHLLELGNLPNVTVQVLPLDSGPHPAMNGGFIVLDMPAIDLPGAQAEVLTYQDTMLGCVYYEEPEQTQTFVDTWDVLCDLALTPAKSRKLLHTMTTELT